jgi:hypothetical protein
LLETWLVMPQRLPQVKQPETLLPSMAAARREKYRQRARVR